VRRRLSPSEADAPRRSGLYKALHRDPFSIPQLGRYRHGRQEGDPDARRDHVHDRVQAHRVDFCVPLRPRRTTDLIYLLTQAVSFAQEDDVLVFEVDFPYPRFACQRVRLGEHDHERVGQELHSLEVGKLRLEGNYQEVEPAAPDELDQVVRLLLAEEQAEVGEPPVEERQGVRQDVRRNRRQDAEAKNATERISARRCAVDHVVDVGEDPPRRFDKLLAGRCHHHSSPVTLEEPHAERFLELLNLRAQARLGDEALCCCLAKAQ
jgi:hypothetical protein